jgi:hypothetical protein
MDKLYLKRNEAAKLKTAKTEAFLGHVKKVKFIAWKPDVTASAKPLFNDDCTLKGHYICKYRDETGDFKEVEVSTEWAENNFSVVALAYAQRKAYEHLQTVEVIDDKGKKNLVTGFVSVEDEGVDIPVENHIVHKIRYCPGKTWPSKNTFQKDAAGNFLLDPDGNKIPVMMKIPGQWQAYSKETKQAQYILENELLKFVSSAFLANLKRLSLSKTQCFIEIPPGASRGHVKVPDELLTGPLINYRQVQGKRTCLVSSLSSLLHFVNARQHAAELFYAQRKFNNSVTCWKYLDQYLYEKSPSLKIHRVDSSQISIEDIDPEVPIVTCLAGSDSKEDHTVCIYKGWIFDGNFDNALVLCRDSLDICCSDDEDFQKFQRFCNTYMIPSFHQYLKENNFQDKQKARNQKRKQRKKKTSGEKRRGNA